MSEESKEVVETGYSEDTKKDGSDAGEEKKEEGKFGKWWKGVKKSASDAMLEAHIESACNKANHSYSIYLFGKGVFGSSKTVYGDIKDGTLIAFGKIDEDIKPFSIVIDSKDNKAYNLVSIEKTETITNYEGTDYTRPGMKISLDSNVEEVKVIKAGDRYFLYKGEAK